MVALPVLSFVIIFFENSLSTSIKNLLSLELLYLLKPIFKKLFNSLSPEKLICSIEKLVLFFFECIGVNPEEIVTIDGKKFLKNDNTKKIIVGPSESMSKSKKNTIDPEKIIKDFGADSVRLFILSDSPPEKDVQWSDEGMNSSFKFVQKLWILHQKIIEQIELDHPSNSTTDLEKITNQFIKKVTINIENFFTILFDYNID